MSKQLRHLRLWKYSTDTLYTNDLTFWSTAPLLIGLHILLILHHEKPTECEYTQLGMTKPSWLLAGYLCVSSAHGEQYTLYNTTWDERTLTHTPRMPTLVRKPSEFRSCTATARPGLPAILLAARTAAQ